MDQKRRPASHEHVLILQNRVDWLEQFVRNLQQMGHAERDALLRSISLGDDPSPCESGSNILHLPEVGSLSNVTPQLGIEGALSYHGPTSIYRVFSGHDHREGESERSLARTKPTSNVENVLSHFGIDLDSREVSGALMLFFKWHYPHLMFVYRDAFLRDHFGERTGSKYWSTALLLAICALGSLLFEDSTHRGMSEQFYGAAESIALVTGLTRPSIVTVQTFLCLAFYEIGKGNPSKGWTYSGQSFEFFGHFPR